MRVRLILTTSLLLAACLQSCGPLEKSRTHAVYGRDQRTLVSRAPIEVQRFAPAIAMLSRDFQIQTQTPTDVTFKPHRQADVLQLCAEEPFREQFMLGDCTGFAIGDSHLMTARHCIPTQKSCDERVIVFGHTNETQNSFPTESIFHCKRIIEAAEKGFGDLVLIELDRKMNAVPAAFSFRQTNQSSEKRPTDRPLYVAGHPFGASLTVSPLETHLKAVDTFFSTGAADVAQGASGSPLFDPISGEVFGVLTGGETDLEWDVTRNCNKTRVCHSDECRGEQFSSPSNLKLKALAQ